MGKLTGLNEKALRRVGGYLGGRKKEAQDEGMAGYYSELRESAKDLLQEALERSRSEGVDFDEALYETAHEWADGSEHVIYTGKALNTLVQSRNWLAAEEEGVSDVDFTGIITQFAYWAYLRDLMDYAEAFKDEFVTDEEDF